MMERPEKSGLLEISLRLRRRGWGGIALLAAGLAAVFLVSFSLGKYPASVEDVVKILLSRVLPITQSWSDEMAGVVLWLRLPRILLGCLVGGGLSAAGAAYQSAFQNAMASPDLLGATAGSAFGAALAILLGGSSGVITASAFAFGLLTVGVTCLVGSRAQGNRVVNFILAGIMMTSLFTAGTSYIKLIADPTDQLPAITYWLMGSLNSTRLHDLAFAAVPMSAGILTLVLLRWRMNLLTLGDDAARSMGVNADALRLGVTISATLITASAVAVSGMIGWVGLVIPHLCRRLVGADNRYLLPASVLLGAAFLVLVDDAARCLSTSEIPIGILTAVIGAPFFLYLILRKEGPSCC